MDALWSHMRPQDWIVLGLIASMPVLMVVAIWLIRSEVRQGARRTPARASKIQYAATPVEDNRGPT